ncbi:hypothetical protein KI387_025348 [Taxus chinensis]|uniref:Nodulin-like domain-containing protein n=1 Tax=Taxus chinensis TaxID=29808 RepID=A0AA38G504_TAXCH|nr:hypothetical protein KI387_025348 [Taxus chinensis]
MSELVPSVLARKWLGFGASICVQAFAGNTYAFPNYSPTLKKVMHYNQLQLNNLGVAKDLGENVGLIAGLVCNKLPPWVLLSIGAFNGLVGYGVLWLASTGRIPPLPYWQMCVALGIGANSSTWFNTAVLLTCMRNFPHSRGTVVGILKGFVGLSGAIFSQLSTAIFPDNPIMVLFLLAVAPTIVSLVAMHFIVPVKPTAGCGDDPDEQEHFVFIIVTCIGLAIYILGVTILDNFVSLRGGFTSKVIAVVMLTFLAVPLLIPSRIYVGNLAKWNKWPISTHMRGPASEPLLKAERPRRDVENDSSTSSLKDMASQSGGGESEESLFAVAYGAFWRLKKGPRRGQDFKLKQALVKADFWLLFFSFLCGVGSGVTAINNMGQLAEAQGYSDVSMFISLIGVWNFLGRLGGGALSECFVRAKGIPRTIWMATAQGLMLIAHLLFASAIPGSLHAGSAILGICYGAQFTVMVPTASELFGLKHFGIIFNFITLGDPLGSFLFSGWLAGTLYDREAERQREWTTERPFVTPLPSTLWGILMSQGQGAQCRGAHCFRLTFLVMAGVCVVGVISSLILSYRIRPVYRMLYEAREATISNSKSKDAEARDNLR